MLEISSVGAKVKYAIESKPGVRPETGYIEIPNINEAPEISMSTETLDASDISDKVTRYIPGRQDPGGEKSFTANHTEKFIEIWEKLVKDAGEAYDKGLACWFEYVYPAPAKKSFFWAGIPMALGNNGIQQNQVDTIPASVICTDVAGWKDKSTDTPATEEKPTTPSTETPENSDNTGGNESGESGEGGDSEPTDTP